MAGFIEGRPHVLIHNGHLFEDVMAKRGSPPRLEAALRQAGVGSMGECHSAILENNGTISVVERKHR